MYASKIDDYNTVNLGWSFLLQTKAGPHPGDLTQAARQVAVYSQLHNSPLVAVNKVPTILTAPNRQGFIRNYADQKDKPTNFTRASSQSQLNLKPVCC